MNGDVVNDRFQVTLPEHVRDLLDIRAGDMVTFAIEGGEVTLLGYGMSDRKWAISVQALLPDWESAADDEAFADL